MPGLETSTVRKELHALLERIPDAEVSAARDYLLTLVGGPVESALLNAGADDEPLSEHERQAIEQAEARSRREEPAIAHEEILREFGILRTDR